MLVLGNSLDLGGNFLDFGELYLFPIFWASGELFSPDLGGTTDKTADKVSAVLSHLIFQYPLLLEPTRSIRFISFNSLRSLLTVLLEMLNLFSISI